jgi:hypothetical protein
MAAIYATQHKPTNDYASVILALQKLLNNWMCHKVSAQRFALPAWADNTEP